MFEDSGTDYRFMRENVNQTFIPRLASYSLSIKAKTQGT